MQKSGQFGRSKKKSRYIREPPSTTSTHKSMCIKILLFPQYLQAWANIPWTSLWFNN